MLRILLIQPGSTEFDEQGRIKGSLDLPLSVRGAEQVARMVESLAEEPIDVVYTSPSQSAMQTAEAVAENRRARVRRVEKIRNLDHGLWHGKLIEEVKQNQPRVYRQGQEKPALFSPPGGEPLSSARLRAQGAINKLVKKHKNGTVALVVSEPLASIIRALLLDLELESVWKTEQDSGLWTLIEVPTGEVSVNS